MATGNDPIIVLTFAHSGSEVLTELLSRSAAVSCTARTGLLPMCESVASTWRQVERRPELTALAVSSIRALVTSMTIARTAHSGAQRWCETAISGTGPASTFLKVFPQASFICLHRRCEAAISSAARRYARQAGRTQLWPTASAEAGDGLTAACAHWAESTRALLDFQRAHPESSLRLRREDLDADGAAQLGRLWPFLGLTDPGARIRRESESASDRLPPAPDFPGRRLPPPLREAINELHAELGYLPLPLGS
jgi:hypothetical protein